MPSISNTTPLYLGGPFFEWTRCTFSALTMLPKHQKVAWLTKSIGYRGTHVRVQHWPVKQQWNTAVCREGYVMSTSKQQKWRQWLLSQSHVVYNMDTSKWGQGSTAFWYLCDVTLGLMLSPISCSCTTTELTVSTLILLTNCTASALSFTRITLWTKKKLCEYTVSQKKRPTFTTCYNFYIHSSIATMFGINVAEKVGNHK